MENIGNDYYVMRFTKDEDYETTLFGGPWLVSNHYLTIQKWHPTFDAKAKLINNVAVWVRIPQLPIQFFNKKFLAKVGNCLGKTLRMDKNTLVATRRKYAHILIEVDLSKPLVSKFIFQR